MRKFVYADPPYKGQAKKHYGPEAREVNWPILCENLKAYDGFALSCHVNQIADLVPMLPKKTRVMAWVKPFAVFKKNVNPTYAWEPVLIHAPSRGMGKKFVHDWVACSPQMKAVITGQKPLDFCYWLFQVMGLNQEDQLEDMFPGSGTISYAWEFYKANWPDHMNCKSLIRSIEA